MQKSVVHFQGWLGIISKVERLIEIRDQEDPKLSRWEAIDDVIPACPFGNESPFVFECREKPTSDYVKDLSIISVTVNWYHQIDPSYPDKPRKTFNKESYKKLQIVKEDITRDDTMFSELGSLGRCKTNDITQYCTMNDWQRDIIRNYAPSLMDKLNPRQSSNKLILDSCIDLAGKPNNEFVVELIHVRSTPYIQWKDGTAEIIPSLDLEIIDEQLLNSTKHLVPGDFIYSQQLEYKSDDAYFVLLNEKETDEGLKYVVRVLDANVPGKVLKSEATIDANPKLSTHKVKPHPIYQYFKGTYTIVVINQNNSIRIGHVIGTNLDGKINVRYVRYFVDFTIVLIIS